MKNSILSIIIMLFAISTFAQSEKNKIPSVEIKDLNGNVFNTSKITNDGKPIIIDFWATWCHPCIKELIAINENYEDWQEETGVKVYAISIDNTKSMGRVAPFVNGRGWEFVSLLDPNSDFKRAMNVVNVPHTFLIDGKGNIVWQHTSYAEGDEEELYDLVKKLSNGESIEEK